MISTDPVTAEHSPAEPARFGCEIIDALSAQICVLDEAGTILAVNKAWRAYAAANQGCCGRIGIGANYLAGCEAATGEGAEDARALATGIRAVIAGELPEFSIEYPCRSPTERHWLAARVTRFSGAGPIRAVVAREDISEKRNAEAILRQTLFEQNAILEAAIIGIALVKDLRIFRANRRMLEITGYPREEIEGSSAETLFTSREAFERFGEHAHAALVQGKAYEAELQLRRKDGSLAWTRVNCRAVDAARPDLGCIWVAEDISDRRRAESELRESERRFRVLLENIRLAAVMLDPSGRVLFCNDFLLEITGWTRAEVEGQDYFGRFLPEEVRNLVWQMYTQALVDGEIPVHFENAIVTRQGERRIITWTNTMTRDAGGRVTGAATIGEDVTERRRAERALKENAAFIAQVLDTSPSLIWVKDRLGKLVLVNQAVANLLGRPKDELQHKHNREVHPVQDEVDEYLRFDWEVIETGRTIAKEVPFTHSDGSITWLYAIKTPLRQVDGTVNVLGIATDITELKQAQDSLRQAQQRQSALLDSIPDMAWLKDRESRYIAANKPLADGCGLHTDEIAGKTDLDMWPRDLAERYRADDRLVMKSGVMKRVEEPFEDTTGHRSWIETIKVPIRGDRGEIVGTAGMARDITARKQAEESLKKLQREHALILRTVGEGICRIDLDGRIVFANPAAADLTGWGIDELAGVNLHSVMHHTRPDGTPYPGEQCPLYLTLNDQQDRRIDDEVFWRKDGTSFPVEYVATAARDEHGKTVGAVTVFHDITARKQAEARLIHLNRILKLLSDCNSALVHSTDERMLIHQVCEILTDQGGYRLAWVGFVEDPPKSTLRPMICTGPAAGYISAVDWNAPDLAQSPAMRALHSGQPVALHDFASEPLFRPWLTRAESFGIASCIALPLKTQDRPFGVLALHASRANAFDAEEIVLLGELADDLAFGIMGLRTKAERDQAIEARERSMRRAQKSLEDAIQAIAYTVELRDAYTAGHQRRATDLAVRIAEEMGIPQEQIHGIRLASVVHDIGNIQIPASILSKPARLTTLEYRLVQTHCQAGFEILKGIEFPWPIAEVVLQHHERLDGSGYPRGLTADQIQIEARVIAVADVVAAMASHRPYRRALGIDAALAEILRGRGTLYDAVAVDACTRLFRDHGYKLPS